MKDEELLELLKGLSPDEIEEMVEDLPPAIIEQLLALSVSEKESRVYVEGPLSMAHLLDKSFRERSHLLKIAETLQQAVEDVENGISRKIVLSMPPRSGKSYLATQITPAWILQRRPSWPIAITSHDSSLSAQWGRQIRRWIEGGKVPGVQIASDAGAVKEWETVEGGGVLSRSIRESFTGRGAKVLIVDDPHKDFADAHSAEARKHVWDWWLSVAQTRLEPPSLVIVIMTRWHEDDLIARLLSDEYEGDPADWEVLKIPALAEEDDPLGREEGEPLLSPLFEETIEEARERWGEVLRSVGSYVWSALYQQSPAPATGSVFDMSTFRFWTTDPAHLTDTDSVRLIDLEDLEARGRWLDSWDFTFKGSTTSDYAVGQRWAKVGANRFLVAQKRGKWDFVEALREMQKWGTGKALNDPIGNPHGAHVHQRLVEDAANGPAIISALREKISGIKPIKARVSKEARARAVSPEIESGNVYLPHPSQPGFEWVADLISELRNFPHDKHDDQVDAMTQALTELRSEGGAVSNPNRRANRDPAKAPITTQRKITRSRTSAPQTRRKIR